MARSSAPSTPSTPGPSGSASAAGPSSAAHLDPTQLHSISPGGSYSLESVRPGCKIFVQKPDLATGDIEERRAEVLSRREKYQGRSRLSTRRKAGEAGSNGAGGDGADGDGQQNVEEKYEYYVHYEEFNKRLDEWVLGTRLILSREIEWPKPADQGVGSHGHGGHGHGASTPSQKKTKAATPAGGTTKTSTSTAGTPRSGATTPTKSGAAQPAGASTPKDDNLLRRAATKAASAAAGGSQTVAAGIKRKASQGVGDDGDGDEEMASPSADSPMADGDGETDSQASQDGEDGAVVAMELLGADESVDLSNDASAPSTDPAATAAPPAAPISKEQEIEKLRTSGSMTQSVSEVARVKNFDAIQMGAHEVETWYFSPYPIELAATGKLFLCEMCLSYFSSAFTLGRHRTKCTLVHPPGNEIYRHEDISFFEIDGRKQKTWCRNLCLLSKCFLDHKTLYYDVDPFLYYVMVQRDDTGCHTIGYFSKEKESAEGYNVACILTLPQHQRSGFGRLLIDFSYELSKREHKLGSPEKPLSDLGLLGYRAYWAETIVGYLLDKGDGEETSIDEVAWKTCITHADVLHTCTSLNMLKQFQGKHYLVLNDSVLANHEKQMAKRKRRILGDKLNWVPPVFSRAQLQFGW